VWSALRALVQLFIVGAALRIVVDRDDPLLWSWLWVLAMIGFAAWTVSRRTGGLPGIMPVAAAAFGAAALVSLGVLLGLGIFDTTGRTIVPLAGMVVGNSLSAAVLVTRRLRDAADDQRDRIEARLALGQSSTEAFAPTQRDALRTALIPQIETTKAVGIVFLPGAMVGLILAGADPQDAVLVQAAVMYLVLGSVATTTTVIAIGVTRSLFTPDHRLVTLTTAD
jgi:putative ABC transport system permease protein